jgi:hypothetical protein
MAKILANLSGHVDHSGKHVLLSLTRSGAQQQDSPDAP